MPRVVDVISFLAQLVIHQLVVVVVAAVSAIVVVVGVVVVAVDVDFAFASASALDSVEFVIVLWSS